MIAPNQTTSALKGLLTSRKFWTAVLMIAVVAITQFIPDFKVDVDQTAALVVVGVSYIVGVAVDPGPGGWRGVIKSRKFWAAAFGVLVIFLDAFQLVLPAGLTTETLISLAVLVGGYISGVAIEGRRNVFPAG